MGKFKSILNKKEFSQEKLKYYFYHNMGIEEIKKIKQLNVDEILMEIQTDKLKLKFIKEVGYILIGEGYLIMDNGLEETNYFIHFITNSPIKAKNEIIKFYKK